MAAEDIEIGVKLKADLTELGKTVKSVPLNESQSQAVTKGLEAAEKAFNAKDWDTFSKQFNKVSGILTQALAATGNISEALQRSLALKKKIEDTINANTDRISKIQSKYTDSSMSKFTAQGARDTFANWTKANSDIKSANNQSLGRDETVARLEKALELTSGNLQKLTDELAKQAGFSNRQEAFKANRYFKSEEATRLADVREVGQLNRSIETDKGDLAKIDEEIARLQPASEQAAAGLEELYKKIVQLTSATNADITTQKTEDREARKAAEGGGEASSPDFNAKTIDKQTTSLGKAFKAFTVYNLVIRNVRRALREAVKTIKELDKALTEQAMVTGLTRKQTYGLLQDYQNMASRLGTTTKEVSSTMTQFLRQGRSIEESSKLTEAAISAAKVASISAADSINYLTTAINGFRLSADDAMKVSDKFAAVAASAATSYEEIAIALSKVAAQANLAGMSIDYTTALLTKGIETTREAPETIGTALKTVIARMRELGDYGETLGGDTDINNVESQLAYIGIALRDNNGELRSTEDVLNELGGKWDELNANQQAAIAKALAGTRQQSRLIAMMSDYERVIELQEIAQRSEGATMAQMATYMEGMDAALNKVSVAWEKIVSAVTDSQVIINMINMFSGFLEELGKFLSTDFGMVATMTALVVLGLNIIGQKLTEQRIARENAKIQAQVNLLKLKQLKTESDNNIKLKEKLLKEKGVTLEKLQQRKITLQERKDQGILTADEAKELQTIDARIEKQKIAVEQAQNEYNLEVSKNKSLEDQIGLQQMQTDMTMSLTGALSGVVAVLSTVFMLYKLLAGAIGVVIKLKNEETRATIKASIAEKIKAAWGMAGSASAIPVAGWVIAAGILLTILGISIGQAIASNIAYGNSAEKTAEDINKLSKEIYDLNKKSTAINTVISKFDDLDNKVLKTNKDLKEMSDLLESAGDNLSDEEKEVYSSLGSDREKRNYLEQIYNETEEKLTEKRLEQRKKVLKLKDRGGAQWDMFLNSNDAKMIQARDAIYSLNNANLYHYIDQLKDANEVTKETAKATEELTQSMIEALDPEKAVQLLENEDKIHQYVNAIKGVVVDYKNAEGQIVKGSAAEVLTSDDYSITERINAYKELYNSIKSLGDRSILRAFEETYSEWATFAHMSQDATTYLSNLGASIDSINAMASAIQKLGYTSEQSADALQSLFEKLQQGASLSSAIQQIFHVSSDSQAFLDIINAFDKSFGTTILNMGQNIDKFKNTVNSFYEKAANWATMSETDKTSFLSENAELFKGEDGERLLRAFETSNFNEIEKALSSNKALIQQRERLLEDVNRQLSIELAKAEKDRDYAYIRALEEYRDQLANLDEVYRASLKMRLEQQQSQLDLYKEFLQRETDALTEALEKRKSAYEDYFDKIKEEQEDIEYEEKSQTLLTNIAKLSSSTNANAMSKVADLTKQFEELEKERQNTLRERAQEAILQNIDDEIQKVNENLEKLLNNEQMLLTAMLADIENPEKFIASLMDSEFKSGNNTELGMQNYLADMAAIFGSLMPNIDWSQVEVKESGDSLILNIMGKEVVLSEEDNKSIYDAVMNALTQIGKN